MATWKKTNEAWFGDTFDRSSTVACYNTEEKHLCDGRISTCDLSYSPDSYTKASITCDLANKVDTIVQNASVNPVESLSDKIKDIQAQIDDLKKNLETKKENSELRSALKTLQYKREVE